MEIFLLFLVKEVELNNEERFKRRKLMNIYMGNKIIGPEEMGTNDNSVKLLAGGDQKRLVMCVSSSYQQ